MRTDRSEVARGDSFTAAGDGFAPGSTVNVAMNGRNVTTAQADDAGTFVTKVAVSGSQAAGDYDLTATGDDGAGGTQVLSSMLTVASTADGPATASAPFQSAVASAPVGRSGATSPVPMEALAAGLVALGLVAAMAARRRGAPRDGADKVT